MSPSTMSEAVKKPPPSLNRKELQSYLKQHDIRAVGTTEVLRAAYEAHQSGRSPSKVSSILLAQSPSQKQPPTTHSHNTPKKPPPEKRLCPFRSKCSQQTRARIQRAITQRLYLVKRGDITDNLECQFVVLGSTGNVYTVQIAKKPTCTCPDFQKGHVCKHILFVWLKVIRLPPDSPLLYQAALLTSELQEIYTLLQNRRVGGTHDAAVLANEQVRSKYAASLEHGNHNDNEKVTGTGRKRKSVQQDDDCPICFDSLSTGTLVYCQVACGTNFHQDCIQKWLGQHRSNPTCPNCRQPWQSDAASPSREGYTNLGQLQGLPSERDTSTYSSWSPYSYGYKRRRYW